MRHYIALIHKDGASDFGVSFPDLPGCVTAGSSLDEARAYAEEALTLHLQGLAEDKEPVPEPSSLDKIMSDVENTDGVAILVPARANNKAVRVNLTFPSDVLDRIDAAAEERGMSRSGFLAEAAKHEMEAAYNHAAGSGAETVKKRRRGQAPPIAAEHAPDQRHGGGQRRGGALRDDVR